MIDQEFLCLSELLDQDVTSYEYYYSLPPSLQHSIRELDISSFEEMQQYVSEHRMVNEPDVEQQAARLTLEQQIFRTDRLGE